MHAKLTATYLSILAITACSNSSGVLKMGPDTFSIATEASFGKGGIPAAKKNRISGG
jgi:hypothetical protein